MSSNVTKVVFRWYHYAGGFGAILTVIGLVWGFYAHFDMKAHDREMAEKAIEAQEAGKSDVQINLDVPDVEIDMDQTIQDVKDLTEKAKEAAGDTAARARSQTKEGIEATKRYWQGVRNPFQPPVLEDEKPAEGEVQ